MATLGADAGGEGARRPFTTGLAAIRRLLAPRCVVCDLDAGDPLCPGCARDYFDAGLRCAVCALRLPPSARDGDRCGRCLRETRHFDATVAVADYAPPVDRMIAALKFGG